MKKSNKRKMKTVFARSKILAFFMGLASYLYDKAGESLTGKLLTSYEDNPEENSIICRFTDRLETGRRVFRPFKRTVSRLVDGSLILGWIRRYMSGWLYTRLNVIGLFFMTGGIGMLLIRLIKAYAFGRSSPSFTDLFVSVWFVLISVPLLFSKEPLNKAVCGSKTAGIVIFEWLGCKKEVFEKGDAVASHNKTAVPLGLALGVASWWVSPVMLLGMLTAFVLLTAVFFIPEAGIALLLFLLPFVGARLLEAFVIYISICFLLKYIRGKRTVKVDAVGWSVLAFSCIFYGLYDGSVALYGVAAYFLTVNLIKSKKWVVRCVRSVGFSFLAVVVYGTVRYLASALGIGYLTELLGCLPGEGMTALFGSADIFASYLIIVFPIVAATKGELRYLSSFVAVALGVFCLVFTKQYIVWAGLLCSFVFFMVFCGKKSLAWIGVMALLVPFVFLNLPRSLLGGMDYNRITDYLVRGDGQSLSVFETPMFVIAAIFMAAAMFFCLQKNVTLYSKGCCGYGRTVTLSAMAGAVPAIMPVVFTNIFTDLRIGLIYWVVFGLASCVGATEKPTAGRFGDDCQYIEEVSL